MKARNNPRAGCVRTILIGNDEKIVGVHQLRDQGGMRALGFVCMHTGNGYEEEKFDSTIAEAIPEHELR